MVQEALVADPGCNLVPGKHDQNARGLKTEFFTGDEMPRCLVLTLSGPGSGFRGRKAVHLVKIKSARPLALTDPDRRPMFGHSGVSVARSLVPIWHAMEFG
jgi:hypothetical protein